ncbi:MAG: eL32 family ribosomal protein [Candidatus Diapherotrites archaeon]|nr:eL32 family ribosomal protein [Candidatus Diapherotrites archaeon]
MVENKAKATAGKAHAKASTGAAAKGASTPKPKAAAKAGSGAKKIVNKKLRNRILQKKRAMFRGRFGARSVRRVSLEKWQKWRKTRGVDILREDADGLIVKMGYRTPNIIRGLHPSGLKEVRVWSVAQLPMGTDIAVRIAATVGHAKRKLLRIKARELGIRVLN